jgi:hypothetical protein
MSLLNLLGKKLFQLRVFSIINLNVKALPKLVNVLDEKGVLEHLLSGQSSKYSLLDIICEGRYQIGPPSCLFYGWEYNSQEAQRPIYVKGFFIRVDNIVGREHLHLGVCPCQVKESLQRILVDRG